MQAKESGNNLIHVQTGHDTRLFMWYDNPDEVYSHINTFFKEEFPNK
ncbi:MAG: hypothetical protein HY960_11315 [Ignavibacteriae bacterium]|nr:hypothetical protein [Ignavibacteriota bacterium]